MAAQDADELRRHAARERREADVVDVGQIISVSAPCHACAFRVPRHRCGRSVVLDLHRLVQVVRQHQVDGIEVAVSQAIL